MPSLPTSPPKDAPSFGCASPLVVEVTNEPSTPGDPPVRGDPPVQDQGQAKPQVRVHPLSPCAHTSLEAPHAPPWQARTGFVITEDHTSVWLRNKAEEASALNGAQVDYQEEVEVLNEATSSFGTVFYLIKAGRKKGYVRAVNVKISDLP